MKTSSVSASLSSSPHPSSPTGGASSWRSGECRCEELRAVFGAGAPALCGPCELREKRARLIAEGWRDIPRGHRQAYLDCGIATEGTSDGVLWAPCWAASIVDVALGKKWLGAVLCRAAVDPQFRDAAVTVVSLTEPPDDPVAKLYTLAEGHGAV